MTDNDTTSRDAPHDAVDALAASLLTGGHGGEDLARVLAAQAVHALTEQGFTISPPASGGDRDGLIASTYAALESERRDEGGPIVDDPVTVVRSLLAELEATTAALAAAEQQIDTMIDEGVEAGLHLKSFHVEDGTSTVSVSTDGIAEQTVLVLLDAMADMLGDAPNYIEFDLQRRGKIPVSVCIRHLHRPTPHQLRLDAEAERDRLRADLTTAQERIVELEAGPATSPLHSPAADEPSHGRETLDG